MHRSEPLPLIFKAPKQSFGDKNCQNASQGKGWIYFFYSKMYSWLSLSRTRLSRITAYLEVKIWSLPKHEDLTKGEKYCGKEEKLLLRSNFSSFPQYFQYISNFMSPFTYIFVNCSYSNYFSSVLQIWYVEVRISRSISESPLEFEITRVDCNWCMIQESEPLYYTVFGLQRPRSAYAFIQCDQSLHCPFTESMNSEEYREGSAQNADVQNYTGFFCINMTWWPFSCTAHQLFRKVQASSYDPAYILPLLWC